MCQEMFGVVCINPFSPYKTCLVDTIIILFLQVWKLGHGEVEKFSEVSGRARK